MDILQFQLQQSSLRGDTAAPTAGTAQAPSLALEIPWMDRGTAQGGSAAAPSRSNDSLEHSASSLGCRCQPKPSVLPSCIQGDRIVTAHLPLLQPLDTLPSLCLGPISDLELHFLHGFSHCKRETRFSLVFFFNHCVDR